jgi:hypothetical protein
VGPLVLIFLGSVFLLQNTGVLPSNFWLNLWRLWPLVLVLAGIELLFAHRMPWLAVAGLAGLVLIGGAAWANSTMTREPVATVSGQTVETNLQGATQAAVTVHFAAGQLDIGPWSDAEPEQLASMTYDGPSEQGTQPTYTVGPDGVGQLAYKVGGSGTSNVMPIVGNSSDATQMSLDLSPNVPIVAMNIQTGAADTRIDLSNLQVNKLDMSLGAAATSVVLPNIKGTALAHINSGASSLVVEVPRDVAARISYRGGLSTINVDTTRFPQVDTGVYESPNYDTAPSRVDLTMETGFTTIQVK